ncbi:hypothetical protein L484_006248 [Morus notabilis]|uniref:Uncharacterized protein n=1 Tax=Morus notabilis TaxID=981085 RepID=W9QZ80_9ROSA|nr:hypothetical protein L484_006248 [Morus notabilis]
MKRAAVAFMQYPVIIQCASRFTWRNLTLYGWFKRFPVLPHQQKMGVIVEEIVGLLSRVSNSKRVHVPRDGNFVTRVLFGI